MSVDVSIAEVLEHYGGFVSVPDTGWRAIRCPFHDDKTASGSVNLELGAYRCHACGITGDGIKLIQRQENLDFGGAIEFARSVLGASVEDISPPASKRKPKRSPWSKTLFD